MPQGPSKRPFETWLKGVSLGPGFSSGGVVANVQRINILPGFSFNSTGLLLTSENLGSGSWPHDVVWDPASASASVVAQFAPASNAQFLIKAILSGVPTTIAHLDILAGLKTGTITILSLYTLPANTIFQLLAPNPADTTLASVTGTIYLAPPAQS